MDCGIVSHIAKLISSSRTSVSGAQDAFAAVEVLAVFDHDYQAHVLVQEWDHTSDKPDWSYRLWFLDGQIVVPVCPFLDASWPHPPFVQAATIVQEWRTLTGSLGV